MKNEILGGSPTPEEQKEGAEELSIAIEGHAEHQPLIGEPNIAEPVGEFEALYRAEVLAHEFTKSQLRAAEQAIHKARAMGFSGGAGVHTGA